MLPPRRFLQTNECLLLHRPEASKHFFNAIPSRDKTYKSFEGYFHERNHISVFSHILRLLLADMQAHLSLVHNETGTDKDQVIRLYVDWILKRV